MPIIGDTPQTPPVEQPVPVKIVADSFRGVTVDTRYEPATSLLTHIEGASWTVNYYSQVLGADNALSGQDLNRPATVQQYRLIQRMELKVTTPLQYSQDNTSKQQNITGQAQMYPCGVIPNEGDHFLADIGDGREGLFVITQSEKRSVYKDAAYLIDYEIVDYAEKDNRLADLNSKVVENCYFVMDYLLHGQNPLISYEEKGLLDQLQGYLAELRDYYFSRFFSREYNTLLLPRQEFAVYDPFLTKAVLAMCRDDAHPNIKLIRELNVGEDDNYLDSTSIWTAVLNKRRRDLLGAMKKIGLVSARAFSLDPMQDSVRYSGVEYVVYPTTPNKSEDYRRHDLTKTLSTTDIRYTQTKLTDLGELLSVDALFGINRSDLSTPVKMVPAVNPITADSYIFSPAFYAKAQDGQSAIELLLQQFLDDKALSLRGLTILSNTYQNWGALEQFYQLPFVMAMIRAAIRRM